MRFNEFNDFFFSIFTIWILRYKAFYILDDVSIFENQIKFL